MKPSIPEHHLPKVPFSSSWQPRFDSMAMAIPKSTSLMDRFLVIIITMLSHSISWWTMHLPWMCNKAFANCHFMCAANYHGINDDVPSRGCCAPVVHITFWWGWQGFRHHNAPSPCTCHHWFALFCERVTSNKCDKHFQLMDASYFALCMINQMFHFTTLLITISFIFFTMHKFTTPCNLNPSDNLVISHS